ncbi:alpha/beta fold hydrolase [Roseibium salinum]|uniref:Alpha/beta hydrolase n=1 Tax=Roseibium salinum TaxID=1604349 RepID=A0ABT3R8G3_9HYPH|nr:alpha/beta hydrolase [Roseibium sp. DSM 29163]MCX2725332.1 alpha/beta hydrolase [Roseibium sp. DSM 29163]MDN3720820.1 alpha/beta hydrolase [Roseibium salinum]
MTTGIVLFFPVALACLAAAYTAWRSGRISAQSKPDGSFAVVDGVKLHYHFVSAGEGNQDKPVLVFLHGAGGNAYDTKLAFLEAFRGRYPLLFPDRPGLGHSDRRSPEHNSPAGQAQAIAALLEHLDIRSAIVIGHSFGSAVAAALGLVAPERVKGLAFLAPAAYPWPGGVTWYHTVAALPVIGPLFCRTVTLPVAERMAARAIEVTFHPDPPPSGYATAIRLPLLFRPGSFRANSSDIAALNGALAEQSKRHTALRQPALIVTGTEDTIVWPSIHSEGLLKDLPNAELLVLDNAGHMPHHTHTNEIVPALERLAARVQEDAAETGGARQPARGQPEPA